MSAPEKSAAELIGSWGDEPYVPCPRCYGHRQVWAIARESDGFRPSVGEYFTCPLCHGTAEAEYDQAASYVTEREEADA